MDCKNMYFRYMYGSETSELRWQGIYLKSDSRPEKSLCLLQNINN
jgi:hypothetical protein